MFVSSYEASGKSVPSGVTNFTVLIKLSMYETMIK